MFGIIRSVYYQPPFPGQAILEGKAPQCIGAVAFWADDRKSKWQARIGFGFGDNQHIDDELIARNGEELPLRLAHAYFPGLPVKDWGGQI